MAGSSAARIRAAERWRRQLQLTVVNRNGEIVGLIFDGNIESLVGDFVYDWYQNRAVAVHTGGMTEAMKKLYAAQKMVDELLGQ